MFNNNNNKNREVTSHDWLEAEIEKLSLRMLNRADDGISWLRHLVSSWECKDCGLEKNLGRKSGNS